MLTDASLHELAAYAYQTMDRERGIFLRSRRQTSVAERIALE
jgi:hypothetical protein